MDGSEGTKYLSLNDNGGTTVPAVVSGSNVVCYPVSTGVYFTGLEKRTAKRESDGDWQNIQANPIATWVNEESLMITY